MGRSRGKKGAGFGHLLSGYYRQPEPRDWEGNFYHQGAQAFSVRKMNELLMVQRKSYLVVEAMAGG